MSENYTFESVILKSVKIESVGVDAYCDRGKWTLFKLFLGHISPLQKQRV